MKSNVGSIVKNIVEFKYLWVKLCLALLLRWVNSIPSSTLYHQVILVSSKWVLWVLAGQTLTQEQLVGDLLAWESNSEKLAGVKYINAKKGKKNPHFESSLLPSYCGVWVELLHFGLAEFSTELSFLTLARAPLEGRSTVQFLLQIC